RDCETNASSGGNDDHRASRKTALRVFARAGCARPAHRQVAPAKIVDRPLFLWHVALYGAGAGRKFRANLPLCIPAALTPKRPDLHYCLTEHPIDGLFAGLDGGSDSDSLLPV